MPKMISTREMFLKLDDAFLSLPKSERHFIEQLRPIAQSNSLTYAESDVVEHLADLYEEYFG